MYFPRMLAKIRLHAKGQLWSELHENLGKGMDGWCCGFLHVGYGDLKARVLEGGSNKDILLWCEKKGRPLNDADRLVWNAFTSKLGWNDRASPLLAKRKADLGISHRDDIQTMTAFIDIDEGRRE
jgi:hypothetical protein